MVLGKKQIKKIIYFQIIMVMCMNAFITMFNVPGTIMYILDITNAIAIIYIIYIKKTQKILKSINAMNLLKLQLILCVVLLIGIIINAVNPLLVVWGIRNNFRFFAFFFVCIVILDKEDIERIFNIFYILQIPNVILSFYQYFMLGLEQDYLGGIFGIEQGCNAYTNIYLCVICTHAISEYVYKKTSLKKVIAISLSSLIIAAAAELKIFFIEFVLIIILAAVLTKPNRKTFSILATTVVMLGIGLNAFKSIFPSAYEDLVNVSKLVKYNTTIVWGYNISRWGAFKEINQIFFKNNIILNLLGYGFGNCEYSSFDFFTSDFYKQYGSYHYRWFAHQHWFLEGGYLGFGLISAFFVLIFAWCTKYKRWFGKYKNFVLFGQIFSIITILSLWYNAAIKVEIAYVIMFALSAPFVIIKNENWGK